MDYVKNIDSCRCLSLLLVVCTQSVEEFKTPVAGEYKLECWGAGNLYNGGGYSYGDISLKSNTLLYVCVGAKGNSYKGITGGKGGYNGGGDGGNGVPTNFNGGTGGGGATHVAFSSGLLKELEAVYKQKLILVAGGSGGYSNGSVGGFGGGSEGGKPVGLAVYASNHTLIVPLRYGTAANQNSGYKFGEGQQGMTKSVYGNGGAEGGGGGGGGLYGGLSPQETGDGSNWTGGGGSGYVNTSLLTNAKTIAGDTKLPSPNGGTEETTGHSGDGACIISWFLK